MKERVDPDGEECTGPIQQNWKRGIALRYVQAGLTLMPTVSAGLAGAHHRRSAQAPAGAVKVNRQENHRGVHQVPAIVVEEHGTKN